MISFMKTLAERLKYARDRKGWTQAQVAVAADLSTGTVGNIEAGIRQAKGSLPQIAEALGVSYKWLANGIGDIDDKFAPGASNGLSPEALSLGLLFDEIKGRVPRAEAYGEASSAIIKILRSQETVPSAPQVQSAKSQRSHS